MYRPGFIRSASQPIRQRRWFLLLAAWLLAAPACFAVLRQPTPDPNSIVGIGAVLGQNNGGYPDIIQIVKNGPADRDGRLKPNDRIAGVAQGNGQFVSCANMPVGEVVGMIRGEKGTTVRLQIIPAVFSDPKHTKIISLVRAEIKQVDFVNAQPGGAVPGVIIQGGGALIFNGPGGVFQGTIPRIFPPAHAAAPPAADTASAPTAAPAGETDAGAAPDPDGAASPTPASEAGIGVTLAGGRDYPVIARILPGGPAQRDGRLKVNDRITGISQGDAPFTDCKDMPLPQVENLLDGPKDSKIRLQIIPAGAADPSSQSVIPLTREIEPQPAQ